MNPMRSLSLGTGVILLLMGITFLVFPFFIMTFFASFVGLAFLAGGVSSLVAWFQNRGAVKGGGMLFMGIVCVIFSIVCFIHPIAFAETMTWLVALLVAITGVAQIIGLISMGPVPGRGFGIAANIPVVVLGILGLVWPELIVQFVGCSLLIEGISIIVLSVFASKE